MMKTNIKTIIKSNKHEIYNTSDMKTNTESTEYTIDYFIKKFEAIPENEIGRNSLSNHCAL